MSAGPFELHILVLSEDSGEMALASVRALTKGMLRLVDPSYKVERIDLEPEGEEAQRAMQANLGKGHKKSAGHQKLVTIARTVARHILDERGLVLFHVDADKAWSDSSAPSENIRWFHDTVTFYVSRVVDDLLMKSKSAQDKDAIMSRLCLVAPHWCIESWLYQNTVVARALCHKHHRGLDADRFERWERNREELDEVDKPKNQICFHDKYNHELASQGFPASATYDVGKSFYETVERLRSIPAVVAALAATHPGY